MQPINKDATTRHTLQIIQHTFPSDIINLYLDPPTEDI